MKKISFVILTWNSESTIKECLESIRKKCNAENLEYEVCIVDNGSSDNSLSLIRQFTSTMPITLVRLTKNLGTTLTRNMALRKCTGDIICVLDSDTVLLEGSLRILGEKLLCDASIGILAPKLIFPNGVVQESVRHFPSLFGKISKVPGIVFKVKYPGLDAYKEFPFSCDTKVDYAISACWFFRRNLLDEVGYLDEHIFYSPEDIDYGIRVWKQGKKTLYYQDFTVIHYVQQITHKKFLSRIAFSHLYGLIYFFWKHRYVIKPSKDV